MEVGILGLAASGKSTVFNLLTGRRDDPAAGRRDAATVGVARVPDARLDRLSEIFRPRKHTPAVVQYVDVPGLPEEHRAELGLTELRSADELMVVLRGFSGDAVPHPLGAVDPVRDLGRIEDELLLQDLIVVERRLERLGRDLAKRRDAALEAEQRLLERCREVLEDGRPLRSEDLSADESRLLRGFTFLSLKPMLVVLNVDESAPTADPFGEPAWAPWLERPQTAFTRVCATLEGELAELDGDDAAAFMADLGIEEPAVDRVIRESYRLLGLVSFFTVGEDECRAWSIRRGTPAVEAAGVIHSDLARGFIRAEVVRHEELLAAGSMAACRQRGTLRLEGRSYAVEDGDVVHVRFNV